MRKRRDKQRKEKKKLPQIGLFGSLLNQEIVGNLKSTKDCENELIESSLSSDAGMYGVRSCCSTFSLWAERNELKGKERNGKKVMHGVKSCCSTFSLWGRTPVVSSSYSFFHSVPFLPLFVSFSFSLTHRDWICGFDGTANVLCCLCMDSELIPFPFFSFFSPCLCLSWFLFSLFCTYDPRSLDLWFRRNSKCLRLSLYGSWTRSRTACSCSKTSCCCTKTSCGCSKTCSRTSCIYRKWGTRKSDKGRTRRKGKQEKRRWKEEKRSLFLSLLSFPFFFLGSFIFLF